MQILRSVQSLVVAPRCWFGCTAEFRDNFSKIRYQSSLGSHVYSCRLAIQSLFHNWTSAFVSRNTGKILFELRHQHLKKTLLEDIVSIQILRPSSAVRQTTDKTSWNLTAIVLKSLIAVERRSWYSLPTLLLNSSCLDLCGKDEIKIGFKRMQLINWTALFKKF